MVRASLVVLALALAACPRTPAPRGGGGTGSGSSIGSSTGSGDNDGSGAPPVDAAPVPIGDDDCVRFVDHTLAIGLAQQRATKPPEYVPTPEQMAEIRTRLLASKPCVDLTRPEYECALAATTQDALYRCAKS